jgi:hypothetical protein
LEYILTDEDVRSCIEFAVKIYLSKKGSPSRVTGQARGLGTIINDWVGGKAIEIGIKGMLDKIAKNKKMILDFSIYEKGKRADDPDIVEVEENGKKRDPALFVEIKNLGKSSRWLGLSEEQFKSIKEKVGGDLNKIAIVYASLEDKETDAIKRNDLLGAFMKTATKSDYSKLFNDFVDIGKISVEAGFVVTGKDLEEHGVKFTTEDFVYETDIFEESGQNIENLKEIKISGNKLPRFQPDKKYPYPEKIGDIIFSGEIRAYLKINKKSERMYIKCGSDVIIKNKVLGEFKLSEGRVYNYNPGVTGRKPEMFGESRWIATRNAVNLVGKTAEQSLKEIAEKI